MMGLKHNNHNGEIVLARKPNLIWHFFKVWKLHLEINPISYFFKKMFWLSKTRLFIIFTSLIQMQWIKDSHVEKYITYKKKI